MADIKDWMGLAKPDPEWEAAVKRMGGAPDIGAFPDITSLREWILNSKRALTATYPQIPGVTQKDHQIETRDGSNITARVYTPDGKTGCPLAVVYHGGGWCIGGLENEELLCKRMASVLGCVAVNVDYRLAPEHKFPTGIHDCHDATKWAVVNSASFGADPSKGFIISGTSAGGNMVACLAHICRDEGLTPPVTGCHLMNPAVCEATYIPDRYKSKCRSWEQNRNAPVLSVAGCELFTNNYIPSADDRKSELFSPLLWPTGHKNLPPSYFQVSGLDPLRDEALLFEEILREEEGIKTKVDVYPGQPHGFWSIVPTMGASQKFVQDSIEGVQWLLEQKH